MDDNVRKAEAALKQSKQKNYYKILGVGIIIIISILLLLFYC